LETKTFGVDNLEGATLFATNFQGAKLVQANLKRAWLRAANLRGANLYGANLQEADLSLAKLDQVIYEPIPEKLPLAWTLTSTRNNLENLIYHDSPAALVALRAALKNAGMRTQERQITYAIHHNRRLKAWHPKWYEPDEKDSRPWLDKIAGKSESLFNLCFFELTSGYGLVPGRALITLVLLIPVFSLVYIVALLSAHGRSGIWVTWPDDQLRQEDGSKKATPVTSTFFFPQLQKRAEGRCWGIVLKGACVPLIGLYFSVLSAFSLG